jgi:hypothetical protein
MIAVQNLLLSVNRRRTRDRNCMMVPWCGSYVWNYHGRQYILTLYSPVQRNVNESVPTYLKYEYGACDVGHLCTMQHNDSSVRGDVYEDSLPDDESCSLATKCLAKKKKIK